MKNIKLTNWLLLTLSVLFAGNVMAVDFLTPEQEARGNGFLNKELYIYETRLIGTPEQFKKYAGAHLDYQVKLENEGTMFGAGPLFEENDTGMPKAGLIIIRASSFEEAKAIADADPFHSSGIREYTLSKWVLNEGSFSFTVKLSDQSVDVK